MIAPHARYKVWIKKNGEMPFCYGGNIVKAHIGRWSEDCPGAIKVPFFYGIDDWANSAPEHQGVVVLAMDDTPLVSHNNSRLLIWIQNEIAYHYAGLWCNSERNGRST